MSASPTDAAALPPPAAPAPVILPECEPSYDDLVTEDHQPVESILFEKLYRLLTQPLYANWPGPGEGRTFIVLANVGWFYQEKTPAVCPDCLLSLDVTYPPDLHVKQGHSYYQWRMGKPPDVVIEMVSDKRGGEDSFKRDLYARQGVPYYAIYDPDHHLSQETLRTLELSGRIYRPVSPGPWPTIGLGLRLWRGVFEKHEDAWLRWCDADGEIIPTAEERADQLAKSAAQQAERAERAEDRVRQLEEENRRLRGEQPSA
ncbi:MAG TPA: Uma2 family endonuclease [Gemmataceae bacterium]|nr:Uma2 family endonuclease [Gemmataceae bacterium]